MSEMNGASPEEDLNVSMLGALSAHKDSFQVDTFFKLMQKGGNKFSRLFMKSQKADSGSPDAFTVDDMLLYSPDPIPTSLLKLSNDYANRAIKMFAGILKYIGVSGEAGTDAQRVEIAQKLLHQGLKRPELKDEFYMQLIKQTRGNTNVETNLRAWELFHMVTATMPPSKGYVDLVSEHIHQVSHLDKEDKAIRDASLKAWTALKRSAKAGARRTLPSVDEIEVLLSGGHLACIVYFLDEAFEELSYDITTTVLEAVEQLAGIINLQNFSTFTLFECKRQLGPRTAGDAITDEHHLLEDNRYIADILFEFRSPKNAKDGIQSKLLLKKRMFRETDETITEAQFVNLSYIQAQYDYLLGNYPVVREDAAQLCALQMQAEHGTSLLENEDDVAVAIERLIPKQALVTRAREEWRQDVISRYRSLEQFSKEDARLQFLRILRSLPYGNSIFFSVKRIEDPIGLLPSKLVLGINKRGVHFFRPVPKEYLHSAELRDIMQFGSSSQAVFFKMRVAGVLHIFQFETRQGEDICLALQTHINDIMMKRYSKAKAMQAADGKTRESGPRYEKHANQMQKLLEEKNKMIEELQKREEELRAARDKVAEELEEEIEKLRAEEDAKREIEESKQKLEEEIELLTVQIAEAQEEQSKAEQVQAAAVDAAKEAVDAEKVRELEITIQQKTETLQDVSEKVQHLEKQYKQAMKEKDLMEKKMQRLEKSRDTETNELKERLAAAQEHVGHQLLEKDAKINELVEELSNTTKLFNQNKLELEQIRTDLEELEELRDMKADVERKEKHQQLIIENQSKRLEELEKLHKDEQMLRKKYLSQMEDMQGKIRVFCRLGEVSNPAIEVCDEYTVRKKGADITDDEYAFDRAFASNDPLSKVFDSLKQSLGLATEGYSCAIVAAGMAGSGKTRTLFGDGGIIALANVELFNIVRKKSKKFNFTIECWMASLSGEKITDLLCKSPRNNYDVRKDFKGVVNVVVAERIEVGNSEDLEKLYKSGYEKLSKSGADLSKTHVVTSFVVRSENKETGNFFLGRVAFYDLAAFDTSDAGLDSLNTVLQALDSEGGERNVAIPYTSSMLTKLMSDVFGGNSKTMVLLHVAPEESKMKTVEEVLRTGLAMRHVKNIQSKNEVNKDIVKLRKTLEYWKEQAGVPPQFMEAVEYLEIVDARETEQP
ncbi:hypothetical protein BSKO_11034 [Bryopsis sp. KO-2023]|nr:hypothetical protein BSKO_11034 [Bryopsis sp. KO-2023]